MGTERISSFQSSPATTFALHCDVMATDPNYGDHGRWRVRMELHAANGPGGTTGSAFNGPGTQTGQRARDGGGYTTVMTHSGDPFLPSGYANGQARWADAQEFYLVANENGYWAGSQTSIGLRMLLQYGGVNVAPTGSMPIPRIPRAPGKAGTPSITYTSTTSVNFTWSAASRGNAPIQRYEWQVSTSSNFSSPLGGTHSAGTSTSDSTSGEVTLSPNTTYYLRVRAVNSDGNGAWSNTRTFTTLQQAPSAPTIGTPERVSDSQTIVKWTRNASNGAPYESQQVQRRIYSNGAWGAWSTIATIGTDYTSSGAQQYTDTGVSANRIYQYRVRATNSAGTATSSTSATVYTTPGAPSSVSASRTASNGIQILLSHTVNSGSFQTQIQYSTNGGSSWSSLTTLSGFPTSYTWSSPPLGNTYRFRARVVVASSGAVGNGLTSGWRTSGDVSMPQAPVAPTIGTPERVSDSQTTVKWTRNASSAAPYDTQQVLRRVYNNGWGEWTGIATIGTDYTSSGAQSYTDSGCVANRRYQYRIKASNLAGEATSGLSAIVHTTPGAPSSLTAAKTASNAVKLTLVHTVATTSYVTQIQYSTDGGDSWTDLTTLGEGITTYTWNDPILTDPLVFRARVVNDTDGVGDGLTSAWRTSNTVQLAAPPNAPSALNPNGVVFDGDEARVFTWQHNPVDTSPQSQYQIRYREQGAGSWTELSAVASDVSEHEFPAATFENGKSYEWAVRTWGIHEDPSPWSATATFEATTPPVASIVFPDPEEAFTTSRLDVEWSYYDAEATTQSAWQAELVGDGLLEARSGSGDATETTFDTRLEDDETYQVRVRVRDGSGLWSAWDEVTFTTAFDLPPQPILSLQWDEEEGCVLIGITNPEADSGEVETISNTLYRSEDGGATWTVLADDLTPDASFTDRTIPLGGEVQYQAVAWSDLPSSSASEIATITPPAEDMYWSGGNGYTVVARIQGDIGRAPRIDLTGGLLTRRLHYFAGRTLPVEAAGTQRSRTGSVQFVTLTAGQLAAVRALAYLPAPHLIRTPDGIHLYCSIGPVGEERIEDEIYRITFDVQEVEA